MQAIVLEGEESGTARTPATATQEDLAVAGGAEVIVPAEHVPAHILPGGVKQGPPTRVYGTFEMPGGETLYIGQPLAATTTHCLTTGATGTGKSVAAANIALQDWCGGHAVLVIDPHGALLEDILAGVPLAREGDVHILDMESSRPFQFNICRVGRAEGVEKTIEYLMEAIRIGEPASWDTAVGMKEVLENALILAPMPKSMGAETKRIWSALLVREFMTVLMTLPPANRPYTTLIVDELKDSIGTLAEFIKAIVEQLRKYNASANFFAQSFNQLPEDVLLVLKNECRSQICFNCGPDNAAIAADMMGEGVTARDIQKLPPYHAFARLAIPGAQAAPCLVAMLPPIQPAPVPAANGRQKPGPPPDLMKPPPSGLRPDHFSPAELLYWLEAGGEANREGIMAHLNGLSLVELAPVWQKKQQLEQWKRQQLLQCPWIIPDKVRRIQAIAAATIGTPWWLTDFAYARKRIQSAPNAKPENARTQKLYR